MVAPSTRGLLVGAGICALVGAAMWAYKSVVILATDDQPDYWFELALVWFGLSILLLTWALRHQVRRSGLVTLLGWVSAVAGITAALAYWVDGNDEGLFGPAAFAMMVSTVVVLFLVGGEVHSKHLFGKYDFGPRLLAWLYVAAIPAGAILAGLFGERYLEIGLLAVVTGWVIVALGALHPPGLPKAPGATTQ
ncbi:MAG: hypothetical protein ACR2OI_04940 [Acidimicrobiia bacterium]